ncbi:MAG: hypothetical protein ACLP0A_03320 [Verrucomicrobiia bacterium]
MTPTPPLGDEETARRLPDWPLNGRRMTASLTDGRTPLGCRADAGRMPRGRTSRRTLLCSTVDGNGAVNSRTHCRSKRTATNAKPTVTTSQV